MGSLIAEIRQSESNAFLELLGHVGVTVQGVKSLRKLPPATLKQLAAIIETGNVKKSTLLAVFYTFNLEIGGVSMEELGKHAELDDSIVPVELPEILTAYPRETRSFVIMDIQDLCSGAAFTVRFSRFLDADWLSRWSEENLLGFRLKLCRADVVACLLPICQEHLNADEAVLWVASKPIQYIDRASGANIGHSVIFQVRSQKPESSQAPSTASMRKYRLEAKPSDGRDVRREHYVLFEITAS